MAGHVNKIRRTITLSACIGQRVNEHGEFEDFCEVWPQDLTPEKASNIFRRKYNDQSITICHVEKDTKTYVCSVDEFIAYAHEVPTTETKE